MTSEPRWQPDRGTLKAEWLAAEDSLRDAIGRFATQARFEDQFYDAFLEFWGVDDLEELPISLEEDETPEFLLAFEWYLYDYRDSESGQRMIELFADVQGKSLSPLQNELLQKWIDARLAPYEVLHVEPGTEYSVQPIIGGLEELTWRVDDPPTSKELRPGDLMVARLLPVGEIVRPSSVFRTFRPSDLPRLSAMVLEWYEDYKGDNPEGDWSEFLRDQGYLFNDYALERQALAERMAEASEERQGKEEELEFQDRDEAEFEAAVLRLEKQYRAWIERPTPALGGLTPQQAVEAAEWRKKIIRILREMGEIELSYALVGEPAFEITSLLPLLRLEVSDLS